MRIVTQLQPRFKWWNLGYAILCFVLGAWGAWDYWVTIPARLAAANEYEAAGEASNSLQTLQGTRALTAEEVGRYESARSVLDTYANAPPAKPPAYDSLLQFWVYFIGCGVLGTPFVLWTIVTASRKRISLEADGSLIIDGIVISANEVTSIDMSRWMSKSIVTIQTQQGSFLLDDYKHLHVNLIAGALAQRFFPGKWTETATVIESASIADTEAE